MSRDVPGDGLYLSGLGSFASRTCYANSSGDHLVRMPLLAERLARFAASRRNLRGGTIGDADVERRARKLCQPFIVPWPAMMLAASILHGI